MSSIQIFESPEFGQVRTTTYNGEIAFVAKDVAERLGYTWDRNLIKHVPDEWKGVNPIHTLGGTQEMAVLTEQGLYFFLARSDKPLALPFQKWIAGDVLPTIRKQGYYASPNVEVSPHLQIHTIDGMPFSVPVGATFSVTKSKTGSVTVRVRETKGEKAKIPEPASKIKPPKKPPKPPVAKCNAVTLTGKYLKAANKLVKRLSRDRGEDMIIPAMFADKTVVPIEITKREFDAILQILAQRKVIELSTFGNCHTMRLL